MASARERVPYLPATALQHITGRNHDEQEEDYRSCRACCACRGRPAAAQENYDSWPVLKNPFESTGGGGIMIGEYGPVVFGKFCTTNFTATTPRARSITMASISMRCRPRAARSAATAAGVRSTAVPTARRRCRCSSRMASCAARPERCGRDVQVIPHLRQRAGLLVDDAAARDPARMIGATWRRTTAVCCPRPCGNRRS